MAEDNTPPEQPSGGQEGIDAIRHMLTEMTAEIKTDLAAEVKDANDALNTKLDNAIASIRAEVPSTDDVAMKVRSLIRAEAEQRAAQRPAAPMPANPNAHIPQTAGAGDAGMAQETAVATLPADATPGQQAVAGISQALPKIIDLVASKYLSTDVSSMNMQNMTVAHIRAIAEQKRDEFLLVANDELPDPVNDFWPVESAKIHDRAWQAGYAAARRAENFHQPASEVKPEPMPADIQPSPEFIASTRTERRRRLSAALSGESEKRSHDGSAPTNYVLPPDSNRSHSKNGTQAGDSGSTFATRLANAAG